MLSATVDLGPVNDSLDGLPDAVVAALSVKMQALTINLQRHVVDDKLQGQVLHHKTGRLAQSIQRDVETSGDQVTGEVYSSGDVKYAAIHEYGGTIPAHDIVPDKAKALAFAIGGKQVFAAVVHMPDVQMPERSFLRSSLADQAEAIADGLRAAALAGAKKAMSQ